MWKRACLLFVFVACGTDDEEISTAATPCERLRDRLVELRMAEARNVDVEAHQAAMKQALGEKFLAACAKDLSPSQTNCAIAAPDSNGAAQCASVTK